MFRETVWPVAPALTKNRAALAPEVSPMRIALVPVPSSPFKLTFVVADPVRERAPELIRMSPPKVLVRSALLRMTLPPPMP